MIVLLRRTLNEKMEATPIYTLLTFGYTLIFGILGLITLFLQSHKEEGMEYYIKARKTLGIALLSLSAFSVYKLFFRHNHHEFLDFWTVAAFALLFSWMTYATILFLIETPRYKIKNFIIDGISPSIPMIGLGIFGTFYPKSQSTIIIIIGCVFAIKCVWMFYVCRREYRMCKNEIENYYAEGPDTNWIKAAKYIALGFSVFAIITLYVPSIHISFVLLTPILYTFFVFKIVNFAPKKIDTIRRQNMSMDAAPKKEKKMTSDLESKIKPLLDGWVEQKSYCRPNITIKDVASEIGTNHNYLSQYINNHIGTTFQIWLNTLRIEESKALLTDGQKRSIEQIGEIVGFSQIYNFSRWFKIITGTTPFRYKKGGSVVSVIHGELE